MDVYSLEAYYTQTHVPIQMAGTKTLRCLSIPASDKPRIVVAPKPRQQRQHEEEENVADYPFLRTIFIFYF
jgi:hypothetical protein